MHFSSASDEFDDESVKFLVDMIFVRGSGRYFSSTFILDDAFYYEIRLFSFHSIVIISVTLSFMPLQYAFICHIASLEGILRVSSLAIISGGKHHYQITTNEVLSHYELRISHQRRISNSDFTIMAHSRFSASLGLSHTHY